MLYAYPKISKCGLGNMLMTWVRAEIFCHKYGARMLAPQFVRLPSFGAILRGDRYLRLYSGNFDFSKSGYITGLKRLMILMSMNRIRERDWNDNCRDAVVVFEGLADGFVPEIVANREYILSRLKIITVRSIEESVNTMDKERYIGVHVRRGDFKQAGVMTDNEWYVRAIKRAREIGGRELPIRIFSDGHLSQLQFVQKAFPNAKIIIMPDAKPLNDIWALSKSTVMVGSSRSSFSMWAVILGQMPSIWARKNAPNVRSLYKYETDLYSVLD